MCGIVGLYMKTNKYADELGRLTALMLHEMRERGPDSAGFAVYGQAETQDKMVLLSKTGETDWALLSTRLTEATGLEVEQEPVWDHAVFRVAGDGAKARRWIIENAPDVTVFIPGKIY